MIEWQTKQARWRETGIKHDELAFALFQSGPFLITAGAQISCTIGKTDKEEEVSKMLLQLYANCHESKVRKTLAGILVFYWRCIGTLHCLDPELIRAEILSTRDQWTNDDFYIRQEDYDKNPAAWTELFNALGQIPNLRCSRGSWMHEEPSMEWLLEIFSKDNSKTGLLRLAGFWSAVGMKTSVSIQTLPSVDRFHDPRLKLASILIRMSQKDLTLREATALAEQLPEAVGEGSELQCLDMLMTAIDLHGKRVPACELILRRLIELIPKENWKLLGRAHTARNFFLLMRTSGFDHQVLRELKLPLTE